MMMPHSNRAVAAAIALSLGLGLSACGTTSGASTANRSLNSVHQPVVETTTFAIDVTAGNGGLPLPEQQRLAAWFEAMEIRYGDEVAVTAPGLSDAVRADVSGIIARHGLMLSDAAPVSGGIAAGAARVTLTRAGAHVPGCPDWAGRQGGNPGGATSANYGCATNSNLAAMVANPRDLLSGAKATGATVVMTSNKAIATYRELPATGERGLSQVRTSED